VDDRFENLGPQLGNTKAAGLRKRGARKLNYSGGM